MGGANVSPYLCIDRVQSVSIIAPIQAVANGSAPTGIQLLFRAQLQSQYSTVYVGQVSYSWTFGDGGSSDTNDPLVSHTFLSPGTYTVSLSAIAPYSTVGTTYQLTIYDSKATPNCSTPFSINSIFQVLSMFRLLVTH